MTETTPTPAENLTAAYQQVADIESDLLEEFKENADAFLAAFETLIGTSATGLPTTPAKAYFIRTKSVLAQALNMDLNNVLVQYGLTEQLPSP